VHLIKLSPSRTFSVLLIFIHVLTVVVVLLLPMIVLAKTIFLVTLLLALRYSLRRYAWLLLPGSFVGMRIEGERISLFRRDAAEVTGTILSDSLITPLVVVINMLPDANSGIRSIVIFPDGIEKEQFRQLRVLLRWGAVT
jgi:toxin CptA